MKRLAPTPRLECLDGLRGLLAVYVLLGHMAPFAVLPEWLQNILSHGQAAVDIFFALSGLVIFQSLVHVGGKTRPFLILRAARIFPVFLLVFVFAVVVEPWSCGFERMPWIGPENAARTICVMAWPHFWLPELAAHLTMTHGLFPNGILKDVWVSFLGSSWSLSTEWQFYLLALLAVRRSGHHRVRPFAGNARRAAAVDGGRSGATFPRFARPAGSAHILDHDTLCWGLMALAVAGVAWRLTVPEEWQFSRAFLPNQGHFFALGVASVAVVRQESGALLRYAAVLAVCLIICTAQHMFGKMLPPLAWTACLAVQMLPGRSRGIKLAGWMLRNQAAQYLGTISYCLYLVNEPIHKLLVIALSRMADGDSLAFTVAWVPAAIVLPILASMWLHAYVELPVQQWGRLAARRSAAGPMATGYKAL